MLSNIKEDIQRKIAVEQNIIQGATNLKKRTDNVMVIQKCNTNIREARQNIEYLEDTLRKLKLNDNQPNASKGFSDSTSHLEEKGQEYGVLSTISPEEQTFSRLDLIKYDCPSLSQRIQFMLQQLEFKLQVEKQYQEANTKLTKLYRIDGDEHTSSAAEGGAFESKYMIQLLTKSLKKYQAINVDLDQYKPHDNDSLNNNQSKFRRKQLTGVLTIGITALRDVDHIQSPMFARKPESYISIKIDDTVKARTKASRNDRWNEKFNISVDKGNEVEITIYDKVNDMMMPVAVTWLLLSDIAEEIRKKKVEQTSGMHGWANASNHGLSSSSLEEAPKNSSNVQSESLSSASTARPETVVSTNQAAQITTNQWFILEPSGQMLLTLGFQKTSQPERKNVVGGLHRQGAIINRKEEVFEQHGHHFVQKSFYNIMCCAYCGDFLRYTGFQCQDCKFLCHKKCYTNVVTKCIAKISTDTDPDEAKLKHHIPHRFEPVSNRGTKWCCHCGYILPWGKHKVRKCSECGIMCHTQCAHLVPDFCGMSMEMANQILRTIKDTQRSQEKRRKRIPISGQQDSGGPTAVATRSPKKASEQKTNEIYMDKNKIQNESKRQSYENRPEQYSRDQSTLETRFDNEQTVKQENIRKKLNTFIDNNEAYLDFTNNTSETMAVDVSSKTLDPTNRLSYRDAQLETKDVAVTEDRDIEAEQTQMSSYNNARLSIHDKNTLQSASEITEPTYEHSIDLGLETTQLTSAAAEEDIDDNMDTQADFSTSNPFRDMNSAKFEQVQNELSNKIVQDQATILLPTDSNSSYKHQTAVKHKRKTSKRRKVSLDNFVLLKVLGKGNFGKVILSRSKNTGRLCAIKVLKKDNIIQNHDIESARAEKKVFLLATKTKHPFLTNLYCSFQTENRIYFAMEFIGGGDLMWHVQNQRLSVRRAKFYAAEVLLALKYFHDNGVIYRDLKLENILLTPEGHIKIGDYGLCKDEMWYESKTSTFCGTPEFMAPEILKEQGYTRAVDWWAFGVLLYQMLLCQSPFSGDDEDEVFNAILTDEPLYPIDMAGDIVQIFQGLLTKDPENRLGAGPRDALEVMEEPFFRNINFEDMLNLKVKPPYIPEIKSPEDTSYFEQEFTSAPPTLTPLPSILTTKEQEEFRGFSFMPDDLEL
ncbi:protein kinase C NDAI_0E04610 [Naumovozyma dairenensis CBS 421]|uniref:Protein kinase C-like 1 n=1 Tax=Naumovozyma dairenensis (strain ATCC 10597 / BCRC 20456 / CBS 421 / NBRC 0211 / NRRL Y-12639) TaxID=1071378 RepID=G0WC08_NAUDC|nr:hypothetical protein NDAI_0E04610 [Naumovozyma dairenensis CBS 421]CCD25278.1 hypothetical protein NDAI_0E04610 [Naumovozyma dairenensis CBS 421]